MADTITDSAIPKSGLAAKPMGTAPIEESFTENSFSRVSGGGREESFSDRSHFERELPKSVLERIGAVEARDAKPEPTITDTATPADAAAKPAPAAAGATGAVVGDGAPPPVEPPPEMTGEKPAPVPAAVAPTPVPADHPELVAARADRDRFEAANKALLAELEAAKKKAPPAAPAPNKLLADAGEKYAENEIDAVRHMIAGALGIDDPKDARVEAELRDLYTSLTSHVLSVTPEESHRAKRDAARALLLVAREKRERKAEETTATERAQADAEARKAADAAGFIGNRLATKRSDGKTAADEYPLLHQFSERLDGMKPHELVWKVLQHESKTGRIAITQDDDANIAAAAKLIEAHYQDLADQIGKARPTPSPQPSTALPSDPKSPTSTSSASKDQRQQPAARTLTSADASVAPATPPAPKTEPTQTTNKPPKFKSNKERLDYALRRLPK